jgi:hypothetical protein
MESSKALYKNPISEPIAGEKLSTKLLQLTNKCKLFNNIASG